jgi:hypothetical protein
MPLRRKRSPPAVNSRPKSPADRPYRSARSTNISFSILMASPSGAGILTLKNQLFRWPLIARTVRLPRIAGFRLPLDWEDTMVARFDPPHTLAMTRFLRRHRSRIIGMTNRGDDVVIYTAYSEFHGATEPDAILTFIRGGDGISGPKPRAKEKTSSARMRADKRSTDEVRLTPLSRSLRSNSTGVSLLTPDQPATDVAGCRAEHETGEDDAVDLHLTTGRGADHRGGADVGGYAARTARRRRREWPSRRPRAGRHRSLPRCAGRPDGPRSFASVAWACRGIVP